MPDLIAQGKRPQDRWRRGLPDTGIEVTLGRTSQPWAVSWDERVSRQHALVRWNGSKLEVRKLPEARNAIFFQGRPSEKFECQIGEHFVIGQTTFTLLDQPLNFSLSEPLAISEQTFSAHLLRKNKYRDADRRIETLGKLPDIIASATSDQELCSGIVNLLLSGVPEANFVAILKLRSEGQTNRSDTVQPTAVPLAESEKTTKLIDDTTHQTESTEVRVSNELEVLHWDCRALTGVEFSPSVGLVRSAAQTQESVLHIWNRSNNENVNYTQSANVDWAFCTPVIGESCPGWVIYVAGSFTGSTALGLTQPGAEELQDDLKFTELTATTLAALRQVRMLQRRHDSLRNFFAPVVMDALAGKDPEKVLQPRLTDVSVLFCDLRGFSKQSEEASDALLELLHRVSGALGVMTHHILEGGGVVGDFHGDAAMGFWGWPLADDRTIEKTCQTALNIIREFASSSLSASHPLANFRAGLGIASGRAVAGSIGTADQVKVTVFGPVVNLAARLESMTKQLQASVLIDEPTALWIRKNSSDTGLRVRRVARVLPYGMKTPLTVSELLPPAGADCILSNEHVEYYEQALDYFIAGDWHNAFRLLHHVPAEDQVKDYLTFIIAQHQRVAPANWTGVIELPIK
jgi:adenylate cyclase